MDVDKKNSRVTGKLLLHDDADESRLIYMLTLEIRSVATLLLDVAVYIRELSLMGAAWAVTRTKSSDLKWRVLVESGMIPKSAQKTPSLPRSGHF